MFGNLKFRFDKLYINCNLIDCSYINANNINYIQASYENERFTKFNTLLNTIHIQGV